MTGLNGFGAACNSRATGAGISSTASSESGWVTLGAVGMTYAYGVSGLWFAPGCLLGYLVNIYVVAPRLRGGQCRKARRLRAALVQPAAMKGAHMTILPL